ncbi:MAG TPA: MlaD family protein [Ferruginibacter sp.]|nr:MlaD family protein [Ferruginibacter sp.]HRE64712.1 MlaD family protein [Ferruginibacter sp.]
MKINNETKVGILAVVALALLIVGFNFLKGKKFFTNSTTLYARYENIQGLQKSNPIYISGMQVGTVYDIRPDKDMKSILVELNITKDIYIPKNSVATIKSNPISTPSMDIKLGNDPLHLKNKDTLITSMSGSIFDAVLDKVDPVLQEVKKAISGIDTLLGNFNNILDPKAKGNLAATLSNLNAITGSMLQSTASLNAMMNQQTGALAKSLNHVESITGNLANSNEKVSHIVDNLDKATTKFSNLDVETSITKLNEAMTGLQTAIGKMNSTDGTMGKLMNDPSLYQNLASTSNKLNLLLDDLRVNPKRYINISVFGKKTKGSPLMVPLPDTVNSPYYIEKVN